VNNISRIKEAQMLTAIDILEVIEQVTREIHKERSTRRWRAKCEVIDKILKRLQSLRKEQSR
jgi:hypothetical protein